MWIRYIYLFILGGSFGLLASAGVFTVFTTVGLVPRFASKTHTSKHVFLYENVIILGAILGGTTCFIKNEITFLKIETISCWNYGIYILGGLFGFFSGMFIGCLALAIAESFDSIPIMQRRCKLKKNLGIIIGAMALGKTFGSIMYFLLDIN